MNFLLAEASPGTSAAAGVGLQNGHAACAARADEVRFLGRVCQHPEMRWIGT